MIRLGATTTRNFPSPLSVGSTNTTSPPERAPGAPGRVPARATAGQPSNRIRTSSPESPRCSLWSVVRGRGACHCRPAKIPMRLSVWVITQIGDPGRRYVPGSPVRTARCRRGALQIGLASRLGPTGRKGRRSAWSAAASSASALSRRDLELAMAPPIVASLQRQVGLGGGRRRCSSAPVRRARSPVPDASPRLSWNSSRMR